MVGFQLFEIGVINRVGVARFGALQRNGAVAFGRVCVGYGVGVFFDCLQSRDVVAGDGENFYARGLCPIVLRVAEIFYIVAD